MKLYLEISKDPVEQRKYRRYLKKLRMRFKTKFPKYCGARRHARRHKDIRKYNDPFKGLCHLPVISGADRCKYHGGMSRRGIESATWINGRHSKYAKELVIENIQKHKADPDIKSLNTELAILKGLLTSVLETKVDLLSRDSQSNIIDLIKTISGLIDTIKRVEEGYTFTVKNVENILVQVVRIIQKRVSDPTARKQIAGDLKEIRNVQP